MDLAVGLGTLFEVVIDPDLFLLGTLFVGRCIHQLGEFGRGEIFLVEERQDLVERDIKFEVWLYPVHSHPLKEKRVVIGSTFL